MSSALKKLPRPESLEKLRGQIDQVDAVLADLLKQRADLVFKVGEYKRENQLPIYDPTREEAIRKKVRGFASSNSPLSAGEMESLFMALIERFRFFEGCHVQRSIAASLTPDTHLNFQKPQRVVLWGFGLMGSSFYLALNELLQHWEFVVIDPHLKEAEFQKWKSENRLTNIHLHSSKDAGVGNIYVLGSTVEINAQHLGEHAFPEGALVIDLGSTKRVMMEIYEKRQSRNAAPFIYIGGHPLAGKESSGFQNGDAMLFYNKVFCWMSPENQQLDRNVKKTCEVLALCLGAKPFWTTSAEHDNALAWTSHLPQVLSTLIAVCISKKKFSENSELFPGVISDLLRISGSPLSMWRSILTTNKSALQDTLGELIQELLKFHMHLQNDTEDSGSCEELFQKSNDFYTKFKNNKRGRL